MDKYLRSSIRRKILAAFLVTLMIFFLVSNATFRTAQRMIEDKQSVAHSYEVLATLQEGLATLDSAEDHQRGFVLTGDEAQNLAFQEDVRRFAPRLQELRNLTRDEPDQQHRLERLESATEARFEQMRKTIETRLRSGPRQARNEVASEGAGTRTLMDQIRELITEMITDERRMLEESQQRSFRSDRAARTLYTVLTLSFLGLLAAIFSLVWRSLSRQSIVASDLRKSREQYELAVRGSNDGIWDWDLESNTVYFSPRWKNMLGHEDHEIPPLFKEWESRLHPDDRALVLSTLNDYIEGRLPIYSVEFRMRHKDGSYCWILARGVVLRDETGEPYRMAGSHTDVTARKEAERKLAEQNQLLERAMEAEREINEALKRAQALIVESEKMAGLGQMVAGVAHEINNPLSFVTNNVAILQRDFDELCQLLRLYESAGPLIACECPELNQQIGGFRDRVEIGDTLSSLPELIGRTADGLKRIRQIVNDLRLFARLDEGEVNEADLNAGINSTATIIHGHARSRDVELRLELQPMPRVTCHNARINQVMMNLISNAIDACESGGVVTIRTLAEDGFARIDVIDTGHGIDPAIRERIFDPFFTTKPIGKGTGLGLSISYGIVHDHGGTIEVYSTPGMGSRFTIRLPLKPSRPRKVTSCPIPISRMVDAVPGSN